MEKRRHEELVEWQCAVTLNGDVRVEFWDYDRFSDVSKVVVVVGTVLYSGPLLKDSLN